MDLNTQPRVAVAEVLRPDMMSWPRVQGANDADMLTMSRADVWRASWIGTMCGAVLCGIILSVVLFVHSRATRPPQ